MNSANTYGVTITDGNGCTGTDNITLIIDTLPVVDLGNDTSICADANITFDAGAGYSYAWTPGLEITQTISGINTADVYAVTITDGNGCKGVDSVTLIVDTVPYLNLGPDSSICQGDSMVLFAGKPYVYNWAPNGEVIDSIIVKIAGLYSVEITDDEGCIGRDTVEVTVDTIPYLFLGNDTSICADKDITLNAGVGYTYQWFPNNEVTSQITVNSLGGYGVLITDGNNCQNYDQIVITIDTLPVIDLGNDTSICIDSTLLIDSQKGVAWLWNTLETTQAINVSSADTFNVVVTDVNGCVGYDTLILQIDTLPVVFLGNDTSICADSTLLLDAQNIGASYEWNIGAANRTISVSSSGSFDVIVTTTKGCVGYDTVSLKINELPVPDLGSDSSLCAGDSMELFTGLSDVSLVWSPTGELDDTIVVSTANVYSVIVTDTNNCVGYDTVEVTVDNLPIVDLGIDSSLCAGDEMMIDAGNNGSIFIWNNGASSQTITVDSAFNYIVTVTNPANCSASDSILVTVDTVPVVNLGMDTAICDLDSIVFDAANIGADYLWSNASIDQAINVKTAGRYIVRVTNSFDCYASDTIYLTINQLPKVDLGTHRDVCEYLYINLGVEEEGAISYLWNTSAIEDSISINSPGVYYIDVVDTNNCFKSDTVVVNPGPDLDVQLIADSVICDGDETTISSVVENETGGLSYSWNTTQTESKITVSTTGEYSVLVIDSKGCWGDDTTYVRVQSLPTIELVPDTLSMCSMPEADEQVIITAVNNGTSVEWTDGSVANEFITNESGWFDATVYDDYGCSAYDSVTIAEYCRPIKVTLPNIFSPNGDGVNDGFIPFEIVWEDLEYMMANIEYIEFKVYNRWGELVHVSTGVIPRWDGFDGKGAESSSGTYFWTL